MDELKSKRWKLDNDNDIDNDHDRNAEVIKSHQSGRCDLPEAILHRILCLLPIGDAVRMSTVSKEWEYLWRSVPKLDLQEKDFSDRDIFMNFVDRTIHCRDPKSPMEGFSLSCEVYNNEVWYLGRWIRDLDVRHLSLDLITNCPQLKLPLCICRKETLMTLHLVVHGCTLTLPEQIYLPSLQELTLKDIKITDNDSIWKLLSCPALERLYINKCQWKTLKALTFSAPMMRTLSIETHAGILTLPEQIHLPRLKEVTLKFITLTYNDSIQKLLSSPSLEKLYIDSCHWKPLKALTFSAPMLDVEIHAPNLKVFNYTGTLASRYIILGSPLLDEVDIELKSSSNSASEILKSLRTLLQGISSAKSLSFSMPSLPMPVDHKIFPTFSNLTNLNLNLIFLDMDWKLLSLLFSSCPSLQALEFSIIHCFVVVFKRKRRDLSLAPPMYLPNLKKINVSGTHELFLWDHIDSILEVFLRDAPVLDEVVLACDNRRAFEEVKLLNERCLSKLPRASESCRFRIIF